ncbi:hypothetical protein PLICRDRAFT_180048 [Plicaturopsis crispa FD-325 SS-3]|uniref:Uncharacterized protein n=1 Tax=Plicaturopsis crispa FD-325 SS-3 TaxID=944288 RepID=A0A0C9SKG5_PLICR|nr:hypothetical protein PLICRDRAFT_180048 [Plicaturopsis crispa FD-325 SS-3]
MSNQCSPKSHASSSHIPVVSPRPARANFPASLSLPQLPGSSQPRRASGGSTPSQTSPASASSASGAVGGNSGIPSFRSLRNLLPFGPGKSQPSTAPTQHARVFSTPSKTQFFGSMRRSMTGERKNSGSSYVRSPQLENSPVLSIEAPADGDIREKYEQDLTEELDVKFEDPFRSASRSASSAPSHSPDPPPDNDFLPDGVGSSLAGGAPVSTDLSTIIEAENSGISKHIPSLDSSSSFGSPPTPPSKDHSRSASPFHLSPPSPVVSPSPSPVNLEFLRPGISHKPSHGSDNSYTSEMDLSTSKLTAEVRDAMQSGAGSKWLHGANGVVIDAAHGSVTPTTPSEGDQENENDTYKLSVEPSFNISALDPDLAALLSPHRVGHRSAHGNADEPTIRRALNSITPPPLTPPRLSPSSPSFPTAPTESSPVRRRPVPSRVTSASFLPRPKPSPFNSRRSGSTSSVSGQSSPERATFDEAPKRRPPSSPLASGSATLQEYTPEPASPSRNSISLSQRQAAGPSARCPPVTQSRLVTPARRAPSTNTTRPPLRHTASTGTPESVSPSRASSALGAASTTRKPYNPRTELRNRKRSMSMDTPSPESLYPRHTASSGITRPSSAMSSRVRPSVELLGPRTVKAFAAAGLLGRDQENLSAGFSPRSSESASRSGYAPSRAGFSEASAGSHGRSRTMTLSDAGGARPPNESPTFSIQRTALSRGSTAPTSVSAASSSAHTHNQIQDQLQAQKEKHESEMGALIAALSDSQRTTKLLREENGELRDRIADLEARLEDADEYIRRLNTPPPPSAQTLPRMAIDRLSRSRNGSMEFLPKRSQLRMEVFKPPPRNLSPERFLPPSPDRAESASMSSNRHRLKRISTSSSVFPAPPRDMTMLMHEEGHMSDRSGAAAFSGSTHSPPSSPTMILPKFNHGRTRSVSSGNYSGTNASFSMTDATGSPRSLFLRPEHELHLGDMASLDLSGDISYDDDAERG